ANAVADDAEQAPAPLAVAGPADEGVGQQSTYQAGQGAEQQRRARQKAEGPEAWVFFGNVVFLGQIARQIGDVEIPAVRRAKIHAAQRPEVEVGQQADPGDV